MYYVIKVLVRLYFRIMYKLRYEGRDNIPKDTTVIYACNHRSYADPPLLGTGARGKYAFMAKEELFRNKLFAWLIRSLGAFPVARGKGDTGVIDTAVERLQNGRSLMIFPEGTRSKDGKVGKKGHTGAALIAARSGKPIIPVGICYGEKLKFRTPLTIKYGVPIDPAEYCEICDAPNPRQLVKLKNRYMADIKLLVEGEPESDTADAPKEEEANE
ncbi:MAG: 1-acyl-sn-glycerol-3-phosphate acyltransferase [Ruminococcus sp.]|uniref:lysophospholipid acyltransferase family protein n=1 Tax=Ruminococcus sp. TaxID=41978 RepID=UPI0025D7E47A|nr:lysophospholipid acyltransferase family protein [Ruminococcus sp.]MBR6996799.1 1-acyl-sn-glycerol-3-phosphate acyltransferase [Ruminococcus sp.]